MVPPILRQAWEETRSLRLRKEDLTLYSQMAMSCLQYSLKRPFVIPLLGNVGSSGRKNLESLTRRTASTVRYISIQMRKDSSVGYLAGRKRLIAQLQGKCSYLDVAVSMFIRGKIWRVKKEYTAHLWDKHAKKEIAFDEKSHAVETLATLEGSWLEYLDIDNKR